MVALKSVSEDHAEHVHWVNWHRVHFKRTVDRFLRAVAALKAMGSPVPEELRGWIMAQTDFSAKIEIPAAAQATGEFATHCNTLTSVLTCCPRMQKVDELPEGSSFKANLKAEQVEQCRHHHRCHFWNVRGEAQHLVLRLGHGRRAPRSAHRRGT